MPKKVLSVLVDNHTGVLARVASLFCQRGFNIDSLTVSTTNHPETSRITIVASGDDETTYNQIMKQTAKLIETQAIFPLNPSESLFRELLLVKLRADETNRGAIREIAEIYRAKIIDLSVSSMVLELTGEPDKIDGFLDVLSTYEILEMCRTGVTALERGWKKDPPHTPAR